MEISDFRRMTPDAKAEYLFSVYQQVEIDLPIARREIKWLRNKIEDLERIRKKWKKEPKQSAKSKVV